MKKSLTCALTFCCLALGLFQSSFAQDNASRTPVSVDAESGNREQDRLKGPVRRVRVETAKILPKDGKWVEGPRELLGIATYDPIGKKIDSAAYPAGASTPPGKEQYLYDDKGNIVEMVLLGKDGSVLSKESYKYEFDELGNWTRMNSSVAVFENGKISFEPTGITYRTISYYYSQAFEKLSAASAKPTGTSAPSTSSALLPNSNAPSTDSPRPSKTAAQVSTANQPAPEAANAHAKKEPVAAPLSVAAAKNTTAAPVSPVANSSEIQTTPDETPTTSVAQHVAEDVLRNAAIELPKPEYSAAALLARASGKVKVQILVDENGLVTNAQATSGHPLLGAPAEAAARKARFSLTKASPGATRVYGVISYDFVPPTPASDAVSATTPTIEKNPPKPVDRQPEASPIAERAAFVELKPKGPADYSEAGRSFYQKGLELQASGQHAEAAEALNQAVRVNPNDANAYGRLAMSYSTLKKHKEAVAVFKMAVQTDRSVLGAQAYYLWGHSYLALKRTQDALTAFKQSLYIVRADAIDPERKLVMGYPSPEQLHYAMGMAYLEWKHFVDSINELEQVVTLNPKNADAFYALAIAHLRSGNRREAEKQQKILSSLDSPLAEKIANALVILPPIGCRNIVCR
ncbi:MAG: TonB family protein [Pyrinomonadaceae bacterium]|nr:TonB family protein [Pyrinomonadaceae bacterium]